MAARDDAELVVHAGTRPEDAQQRLEQREVDDLATALAGVAGVQREHDGERSTDPGHPVGQPEGRQRGRPVLLAGLVGEAAHGLGQRAERAALGVGAELAEAGHAQHHQPGVDLEQLPRPDTPALHHPWPEVLDDHIRGLGQAPQDLLSAGLAEVQRHRPLVAGDDLPPQAVPVLVVAVGAGGVAAGVLDLDHVGAVVAQQHGGDRGGVHRAQVQHPDAGQGTCAAADPDLPGRLFVTRLRVARLFGHGTPPTDLVHGGPSVDRRSSEMERDATGPARGAAEARGA